MQLPIVCPMCDSDVEHLLHVFFDCPFAASCWQYVGLSLDMSMVEFAPDWLLQKLNGTGHDELLLIARVLWGIWFFRNKKVWENKVVNSRIAMDWSAKYFSDWKLAKESRTAVPATSTTNCHASPHRWKPPATGAFKLNTDATFKVGEGSFSIGLLLRDHQGKLIIGKVQRLVMVSSVLEAKVVAT